MLDWEAMQTSVFHNNSFIPDDIGDILYCKVELHLSKHRYLNNFMDVLLQTTQCQTLFSARQEN